jgi:hypothetical protein
MKFDLSMVSVLLAAFAPFLVLFFAIFWDRRQQKHTEKPPQSEKLLRPPGFSLSLRLEKISDKFMDLILVAMMFSAAGGGGAFVFAILLGEHAPFSYLIIPFLIAGIFIGICLWVTLRAFNLFREGRNIRLGISGEQAVAESLNEAADCGFRAFHDLPAEETWNIDHVAVGSRGVFLIETKACRRRGSKNGQAAHEIIFDGEFLQFPFFRTNKPIEQAKRNAKWLSNYLRNKTGEPVEVFPLVVLPGWFIKNTEKGNFGVNVMNANYLPGFLRRQAENIEPAQVRRIITALDEKCRTVEF